MRPAEVAQSGHHTSVRRGGGAGLSLSIAWMSATTSGTITLPTSSGRASKAAGHRLMRVEPARCCLPRRVLLSVFAPQMSDKSDGPACSALRVYGTLGVVSWEADIEAIVERTLRRVLREELHPELLTPAQASALVGRSAKTICRWMARGLLQRHGPGPRPLVSRRELLALDLDAAPRRARTPRTRKAPSAEAEVRRLLGNSG